MKIDFAFVILTYRSFVDLTELIDSIYLNFRNYNFEILVVNSFFDSDSENEIRNIAIKKKCLFLSTENKGYGHGNNVGIEFFNLHYDYKFLVIANPDTKVISNQIELSQYIGVECVIAPKITNLNGKNQNPYWPIKNSFSEKLVYKYYKKGGMFYFLLGIGINKLLRLLFNIKRYRNKKRIYASHGSFLIFSRLALERLGLPYDENMFLFAEENLLAHNLEQLSIPIYYTSLIQVLHKEDGSMKISKINEDKELQKSIIYYYEKVNKK